MSSASPGRSRVRTLLLWAAPLTWLGCGGGGTDVVLPSLSVTTTTQGIELDPDGYSLVVDGSPGQPVGVAATLVMDQLADGPHTVELSGLAANCTVQGENPRTATVRSGSTASLTFAVSCSATGGSVEVGTSTTGSGTDPDGFELMLDGAVRGPIGTTARASVSGVAPGSHSVGLSGLAGNCQVAGENPREVTVSAGQTVEVPFNVTCEIPEPSAGTLEVTTATTGSDPDPDGYSLSIDGGSPQPIGTTATVTLSNVSSSQHQVRLLDIADNCTVGGSNPVSVAVTSGGVGSAGFNVTCTARPPQPGSVRVSVTTSGSSQDQDGYTVSVDGGAAQSLTVNGSRTIQGLSAGPHSVLLGGVAANCTVNGDNPQAVTVVAGQTAALDFSVSCVATGSSVNLRIEQMYLTQSTQTLAGDVPLVQGRDGFIRVFVTASGSSNVRPSVRVRFFRNGSSNPVQTFTIDAPSGATPSAVQEAALQSSWNMPVPGSLIQPNTAVAADVDPDNSVPETNDTDNSFPASGGPRALNVRSVPAASIQFVPIRHAGSGLEGSVGNVTTMVDFTRRVYPLNEIRAGVHAVYTTSTRLPLEPLNTNFAWDTVLSELDVVRIAEGSDQTYFGLVRVSYGSGVIGMGYVGVPSAIASDDPFDIGEAIAHELGHTWGRWHSPCGNPGGLDPDEPYPYPNGRIGVYGFDVKNAILKPPSDADIMSYCSNRWVSDYTYKKVLSFRAANASTSPASLGQKEPSLVIWGHIVNGQPVLEPAFYVMTRPSLPTRPGPYMVDATALDGTSLFRLSFEGVAVADGSRDGRHFAFAVPLDAARLARLSSIRLSGPGATTARLRPNAHLQRAPIADNVVARGEGESVKLQWNGSMYPMILVRDQDTGEVLSLARGGEARVLTGKPAVDLDVSDGVRSHRLRLAISR